VADDEVLGSRRRIAVLESGDLPVGATDADLEHPEANVGSRSRLGFVVLDDVDGAALGVHGDDPHRGSASRHGPAARGRAALVALPL